jgi:hypothetical protein
MLERSSKSVDRPYSDEIKLTTSGGFQKSVESWASVTSLCSTDTIVSEGGDDVPATKSGYTL